MSVNHAMMSTNHVAFRVSGDHGICDTHYGQVSHTLTERKAASADLSCVDAVLLEAGWNLYYVTLSILCHAVSCCDTLCHALSCCVMLCRWQIMCLTKNCRQWLAMCAMCWLDCIANPMMLLPSCAWRGLTIEPSLAALPPCRQCSAMRFWNGHTVKVCSPFSTQLQL